MPTPASSAQAHLALFSLPTANGPNRAPHSGDNKDAPPPAYEGSASASRERPPPESNLPLGTRMLFAKDSLMSSLKLGDKSSAQLEEEELEVQRRRARGESDKEGWVEWVLVGVVTSFGKATW